MSIVPSLKLSIRCQFSQQNPTPLLPAKRNYGSFSLKSQGFKAPYGRTGLGLYDASPPGTQHLPKVSV